MTEIESLKLFVLLDRSWSMNQPVADEESGFQQSAMESAKTSVRKHLATTPAGTQVSIFAFDESTELAYAGLAHDPQLAEAIDGLEPRGGTDALAAVQAAMSEAHRLTGPVSFLLITDGDINIDRYAPVMQQIAQF